MIPVGMCEEQVGLADSLLGEDRPEGADPGARIEHDLPAGDRDLEAGGVAAEVDVVGGGTGDAAADTPEFQREPHQSLCSPGLRPRTSLETLFQPPPMSK